jgi:hypothetical protein
MIEEKEVFFLWIYCFFFRNNPLHLQPQNPRWFAALKVKTSRKQEGD